MKKLFYFILSMAITSLSFSQSINSELVSSSGGSSANSSYQLDWSVGECIVETYESGDYVITQGFHQDTYVITTVEDLAKDIDISVYPNPTTDLIFIDFLSSKAHSNVKITVTNIKGKVLQQTEVTSDKEQLNFSQYAAGIYFLTINQENQKIKSFKIIKK